VSLIVNGPLFTCADEKGCPQPYVCPLSRVIAGSAVRIKRVGASPEVSHRLRELGLCEEQKIKLLSRHHNLICLVCNARLAISNQLAESILVETIPDSGRRG
jgi:Fe2+ transport system protein FeoA